MILLDIIKNPVIIGLFAGGLTYVYMKWKNDADHKKSKNKNKPKKDVNLIIPLAVFLVFWFVSYIYFSASDDKTATNSKTDSSVVDITKNDLAVEPLTYKFVKESDNNDQKSYMLMGGGGISIPSNFHETLFELK
jgi:hypothetical protein